MNKGENLILVSVGSGKRSLDLEGCLKALKAEGTHLRLARESAFKKLIRCLVFLSREMLQRGGTIHRVSVALSSTKHA